MHTSATWDEYMRGFWVEDNFIEPYHPGQNPFERDQALWKQESTKIMIESKVDPRDWYRVVCHTADFHNHRANFSNEAIKTTSRHSRRLKGGGVGDDTPHGISF